MASDGASSISVTVRVRPFTIREAAQLSRCDDQALFLGDGSLAGVPTPKVKSTGIRPVIKVLDEKCLYAHSYHYPNIVADIIQSIRPSRRQPGPAHGPAARADGQASEGPDVWLRSCLRRDDYTGRCLRIDHQASAGQRAGRIQCDSLCLWRDGLWKDAYHHVRQRVCSNMHMR